MKENRGAYIVFLIVIGGFVFLFNKWTPLFCDDWIYNFIYGTQTQIQSLSDVVYSQYIHYFKVNGRLFPHFFIQLFDGLLGKGIFNIVNTLFFVAFLVLLSYTLKDAFKSFFVSSVLALIFIFLLLPGFNNCFLWLSGSCNYLWVAVSLLFFNILLNRSSFHPYLYPLLFIFGVICGWSNEALALGLGAGYFIYYVLHRDKLCVSRIILLLGFYFGLLFLVISPGSIHRAIGLGVERISVTETVHNMLSALFSMTNIRIFPCLLIALLVFAFIDRKEAVVFIRSNIVLVTSIIVTFIFILWTQHDSDQSRFGFELFSLILLLRLISIIKIPQIVPILCSVLLIIISSFILLYSQRNYRDYQSCLSQIASSHNGMILTNSVKCPPFFNRFLVHFTWPESLYIHSPYDDFISYHFKRDDLYFVPQELYEEVRNSPSNFMDFDMNTNYPFYVKVINNDVKHVVMQLDKASNKDIPLYARPFSKKLRRYSINELEVNRYAIVSMGGNSYIIVNKNPLVDRRLKGIKIEY